MASHIFAVKFCIICYFCHRSLCVDIVDHISGEENQEVVNGLVLDTAVYSQLYPSASYWIFTSCKYNQVNLSI